MKKLFTLLLTVLLAAMLPVTVFADVIYIPQDHFYNTHVCQEVRRGYRAMTDVTIYESPESDTVEGTIAAGKSTHVYFVYTDAAGNQWGYVEARQDADSDSGFATAEYAEGWIPMAYMDLNYDYITFEEDYGHQFVEEGGELDASYIGQEIYFYSYPGSPSQMGPITVTENTPSYGPTYTDPEGRVWGFINYHMGWKLCWICVSNPTADFETLYPDGAPQVEITEPGETEPILPDQEIKPGPSPISIVIAVAVIACVVVTALVLLKMKKKNGK